VELCVSVTARVAVVYPLFENSTLNAPDCKVESEYVPRLSVMVLRLLLAPLVIRTVTPLNRPRSATFCTIPDSVNVVGVGVGDGAGVGLGVGLGVEVAGGGFAPSPASA
jgi:hypothetical protein